MRGRAARANFLHFSGKGVRGGTEFISIMFEMKNEMEGTAAKHKNEDFGEKDWIRTAGNGLNRCWYRCWRQTAAVVDTGIVDVSHRYPRMFVVRPQFFIPIITLLRNAALNSLQYRRELAEVRRARTWILPTLKRT